MPHIRRENMSYAIIQITGKQYLVEPNQELLLDHVEGEAGHKIKVTDVLLVNDGKALVGQPTVAGASVDLEIIKQTRSPKLRVAKFKAKSRYRRAWNHRQIQTVLKVLTITAPKQK